MKKLYKIIFIVIGVTVFLLLSTVLYGFYLRQANRTFKIKYEQISIGASEDKLMSIFGKPAYIQVMTDAKPSNVIVSPKDISTYESYLKNAGEKMYRYHLRFNMLPDGNCYFVIDKHVVKAKHFYE